MTYFVSLRVTRDKGLIILHIMKVLTNGTDNSERPQNTGSIRPDCLTLSLPYNLGKPLLVPDRLQPMDRRSSYRKPR